MRKKKVRQKYYVSKEIRTSISLIILWSLLVSAFFTYFAKELGEKIGSGVLLFAIVMVGYVAIVIGLTLLFSHRLVGPFQRLKTEMKLIIAGDYHKRLNVRTSDDIYIKSFIMEVNTLLEAFEKAQSNNEELNRHVNSELMTLLSLVERQYVSKDILRENILSLHSKVQSCSVREEDTIAAG
jgi:nitrogen fixation/metabolism regulation signal transduction histidine kinase